MKHSLVLILTIGCSIGSMAQTIRNASSYSAGLQMIESAQSGSQLLQAAEYFKKLALENEANWLSHYYTGFSYTMASYRWTMPDARDSLIDEAQKSIDNALELNPEEPELLILQALIFQARIQVSPQARGMNYSMKAASMLQEAKKKDPGNPRAQLLMAYNTYYTPEMVGGGPEKALPMFVRARELFDTYSPESDIHPQWGMAETLDMIETCKQQIQ